MPCDVPARHCDVICSNTNSHVSIITVTNVPVGLLPVGLYYLSRMVRDCGCAEIAGSENDTLLTVQFPACTSLVSKTHW